MIKRHSYILLVILIFSFVSCEDSISPKEEFKEEYILNCIISSNSSFQKLSLLRSFNVGGFNPEENSENPFVSNADITLSYRGESYSFRDTAITPVYDQRFEGPLNYYYLDNFQPNRTQSEIKINAVLPDGTTLEAIAETPISFSFQLGDSNRNIPPADNSSNVNLFWQPFSTSYFQYYQVSLRIHYEELRNGKAIKNFVQVPIDIEDGNESEYLIYPSPRRLTGITYPVRMIDIAMLKIAEEVENVDSVFVSTNATFQVLALDANLAAYYFAGLSENIYTVRLDEILYSNVEGGYGVFGVIWEEVLNLAVQQSYIKSFGYNVKEISPIYK